MYEDDIEEDEYDIDEDSSVYDEDSRDDLIDDDEISTEEEAFMKGYEEDIEETNEEKEDWDLIERKKYFFMFLVSLFYLFKKGVMNGWECD